MKKLILITIVCLIVTCPVNAQAVDSIESIEGTVWTYKNRTYSPPSYVSFYDGLVYYYHGESSCFNSDESLLSAYIDLPGIGLFWAKGCMTNQPLRCERITGVLFPRIGVGIQSCIGVGCYFMDRTLELVPDMSLPEDGICPVGE